MELPTLAGIEDALTNIRPHLPETPLVQSELLSRAFEAEVWLKNETVSPIASFKLRGAFNDLVRKQARGGLTRAVTFSTGNNGQGVAYGARLLGLPSDVFVPEVPNPVKVAMMEAFGATVHKVGHDPYASKMAGIEFAAENGYHFVDDGHSLDLMEGQGTIGLEIARALDGVDAVFVPVGDAPLITGTGTALKALQPDAQVIGVQSERAPALARSFHEGKRLEVEITTLADGLSSRIPAERAFAGIRAVADDVMLVSDEELLAATHTMAESAHVLVELAGAAALAGAWRSREAMRGKRIVLILSGANENMAVFRRVLDTPPLIPLPG